MPVDLLYTVLLPVTAATAGALALLLVVLALATVRVRLKRQVSIGDGGDPALARLRRTQRNFTEYVPLALVLLALTELNLPGSLTVPIAAGALLVGRVLHAWGLGRSDAPNLARVLGTVLTLTAITLMALALLYQAFNHVL